MAKALMFALTCQKPNYGMKMWSDILKNIHDEDAKNRDFLSVRESFNYFIIF